MHPFSLSIAANPGSAWEQQGQKACRIRSTVWFAYTNNFHKLFTELQSFDTDD